MIKTAGMNPCLRRMRHIRLLVSERQPDGSRRANHAAAGIDLPVDADSFIERDRFDFAGAQTNHTAKLAARDQFDGFDTKARCKNPVEGAWRSSALDVPPHDCASFISGALFNFARQYVGDAAELGVAEFILTHILQNRRSMARFGRLELGAFGNNDADNVPALRQAIRHAKGICLDWAGEVTLAGKRVAVVHGHLHTDVRKLLAGQPDYLLSGHSHRSSDTCVGVTRRINPGALHRATEFTVALLDLERDALRFLSVAR